MSWMQRWCVCCGEENRPKCYGYVAFDDFGHKTVDCSANACSHKHNPKDCLFSGRDVTSGLCKPCLDKALDALRERRRKRNG